MASRTDTVADRLELESSPAWPDAPPLSLDVLVQLFERHVQPTVGVEEELMLLAPATLELAPAVERVLELFPGDGRFHREIRASQIEINSPIAGNANAAGLHLARARLELSERLAGEYLIAAAGTHPFSAAWGDVGPDERYRQIADEYVSAVRGDIPSGLHVHVAASGADRALAVYNAVRSFLPEIAALGANSPFLDSVDTGLACARRLLNEGFQRSGVPPPFPSWESFLELVEWGRRGGLFPDATHFWWDLRPHPRYGTLELRIADTQTRVEDAVAIAAVFQSLCEWLGERWSGGHRLPVHDSIRIRENAWRAIRYGIRGWMVDLDHGTQMPTRDRLARLFDRIEPAAERLGNLDALHTAHALLADNGAERQRYVHARNGLRGLTAWLAEETVGSAADFLSRRT